MVTFFALPVDLDPQLDQVAEETATVVFQWNVALAMDRDRFTDAAASVQKSLNHLQHCFQPVLAAYQKRARAGLADAWAEYCLALRDRDAASLQERPIRDRLLSRAEQRMLQAREEVSKSVARVWGSEIRDLVAGLRALVARSHALLRTDHRCAA